MADDDRFINHSKSGNEADVIEHLHDRAMASTGIEAMQLRLPKEITPALTRWLNDEIRRGNTQASQIALCGISAGTSVIASLTATAVNGSEKDTALLLALLRPRMLDMFDQHVINAQRAASQRTG